MISGEIVVTETSKTPLLDTINVPADLRRLPPEQLTHVAAELRLEMIDAVSVTGGHLGAGLGVVELTVALHYVFDTPSDRLIWDVGHQSYPHKILTGRRSRIRTLRQGGGLSGFTRRSESEYDPFGAAHSSTSISAALGMAVARDLTGGDYNVLAVIGDGAMSAGMAYEAMNNAAATATRLIVILNDNDMSIARPVGAMSAYLSRLISSRSYRGFRHIAKQMARAFPKPFEQAAKRAEEFARGFVTGGTLFEELGFYYIGPIDGHNLDHLLPVLRNVRDARGAADPGPRGDPQGPWLSAGRSVRRQVSRRHQVRRHHRRHGQKHRAGAELYESVRRSADRRGRTRREDRGDNRGHALRHRSQPVRGTFPETLLRCRNC